jgi:hypothetical protein
MQLGDTSRADISADGTAFDFQLEHVEVDGVAPITEYVIARDDGASSYLARAGYPADDEIADGLLLPPDAPDHAQPLFDKVTFGALPANVAPRFVVRDGFGVVRWIVDGPQGAATFTPPKLDGAALRQLSNADRARLVVVADRDPNTGSFSRAAASREVSVEANP